MTQRDCARRRRRASWISIGSIRAPLFENFNKVTEQLSPAETYTRVKRLDAEKDLIWLEPSRINNSYALAMRRADADRRGGSPPSQISPQRCSQGERIIFASNSEFYDRSDGLRPLEQAYGFRFGGPDRVVRLDTTAFTRSFAM